MANTFLQPAGVWFPASDGVMTLHKVRVFDEAGEFEGDFSAYLFALPLPFINDDGTTEEIEDFNREGYTAASFGEEFVILVTPDGVENPTIIADIPDNYAFYIATNAIGDISDFEGDGRTGVSVVSWSKR